METALTILRLNRSIEKRKITVEVGLPRDATKAIEKLKSYKDKNENAIYVKEFKDLCKLYKWKIFFKKLKIFKKKYWQVGYHGV